MSDSLATPWTVAHLGSSVNGISQAGILDCHILSWEIFPTQESKPTSPAFPVLAGGHFTTELAPGKSGTLYWTSNLQSSGSRPGEVFPTGGYLAMS